MATEKKKERRLSLFLGYEETKNHFVDEKIYEFYNSLPNRANIIKQVLFEYAINNSGGNIVTATVTDNNTLSVTPSATEKVTLSDTANVTSKVTDNVQIDVTEKPTESVQEDLDLDFEIKEVSSIEKKKNEEWDMDTYINSMNNFNY